MFLMISGGREKNSSMEAGELFSSNEVHTVTFLNANGDVLTVRKVENGGNLNDILEYRPEGYVFAGWEYPSYANLSLEEFPVYEDMTLSPSLYEQKLMVLNALGIAEMEPEDVDMDALDALIDYLEMEASNGQNR